MAHLDPPYEAVGTWYHSTAPEETKLVRTGKGILNSLFFENKSSGTVFVYVYDGTDTSGTLLAGPFAVVKQTDRGVDYPYGRAFATGLYIAASSSDASYAATSSADLWIEAGYTVP